MQLFSRTSIVFLLLFLLFGCDAARSVDQQPARDFKAELRMNQVQVIGTHNSYHIDPHTPIPTKEWSYTHLPLDRQLGEQGVRQIELDLYWSRSRKEFDVYHILSFDPLSTCKTFKLCLQTVKEWSDKNQTHLPIMIMVEAKSQLLDIENGFEVLEQEILSVFPPGRIVTPALVQGSHPTLLDAVRTDGWPRLNDVRGRVVFMLLTDGDERDAYANNNNTLKNRLMFVSAELGSPIGAMMKIDDPIGGQETIKQAIRMGVMVRTRSDSGGDEPRVGDTTRLEAALSSGAHYISTDFPGPVDGIPYVAEIPDGLPGRCNPITAQPICKNSWLELVE